MATAAAPTQVPTRAAVAGTGAAAARPGGRGALRRAVAPRCSCPAWSRAGRCRPRTTCGPRRRGPRAGLEGVPILGSNREQTDAVKMFQPLAGGDAAAAARPPALGPVHHGRAPAAGQHAVGRLLPLQRPDLRPRPVELAGARGGPEGLPRRPGHVLLRPAARDAPGRGVLRGARLRLQPVVRQLGLVDDDERLGLPAARARPRARCCCGARGRCRSRGWRCHRPAVVRRPPGHELPGPRARGRVLGRAAAPRARGALGGPRCGARRGSAAPWRAGTALAAVLLIPFLELLRESIDLQERSAHPAPPAHALPARRVPARLLGPLDPRDPHRVPVRPGGARLLPRGAAADAGGRRAPAPHPRARDGRRRRARRAGRGDRDPALLPARRRTRRGSAGRTRGGWRSSPSWAARSWPPGAWRTSCAPRPTRAGAAS